MLHSEPRGVLFAVSASVMSVLGAEERIELTVDSDSAGSGEAVVMPGRLEPGAVHFGLAVESVEERRQLEVLEPRGWTALVIPPWTNGMPLGIDDQIEVFAGY